MAVVGCFLSPFLCLLAPMGAGKRGCIHGQHFSVLLLSCQLADCMTTTELGWRFGCLDSEPPQAGLAGTISRG